MSKPPTLEMLKKSQSPNILNFLAMVPIYILCNSKGFRLPNYAVFGGNYL